ncbi:hypothetical protein WICPIJ_001753 [Wickerhamomyces pijperi]|uniref:Uncharacterized protein n=1 Tax=Wickerhamomyces pijperi TaxID=599730 RepID=A0A9P8TQH0_WICPI|nr:hypothetical protein WICPIJ_001753 [Wickerhamomyces pijperi]
MQFWQIWEGALTNILHILEVEFEEYKEKKKNSTSFKETALFSFISANIQYGWESRFVKLLTVPYNSELKPFQNDDLKLCEGQLLTDFYKRGRSIIINSKNFRFIRRILTLTFEVLKFIEKVEHSGMWKESTLVREFSRTLLLDANLQDLQALLIVQRQDIANSNELHVLLKIARAMIIDLTKVDVQKHRGLAQLDDFKWLDDSHSALYIITLFQTVKLQKLSVDEGPKRILERYRKVHFLLMKTLEIWIKVNFNQEKKLPESIIIQLLEAAEAGDRLRTKDVSTESRSAHPEEIINSVNRKYNTTYLTLYQTLKAQVGDPRKKKKKTMTTTTTTTKTLRTENEITATTPAKTVTERIHKHGTALSQSSCQRTVSMNRTTSAQSVHKRSSQKLKPITKAVQPAQPVLPAQDPQASISLDNDSDDLMIIGEQIIEKKDETHDNDSDSSVEFIGARKLLIKSKKFKVTDRAGVEVIQID